MSILDSMFGGSSLNPVMSASNQELGFRVNQLERRNQELAVRIKALEAHIRLTSTEQYDTSDRPASLQR